MRFSKARSTQRESFRVLIKRGIAKKNVFYFYVCFLSIFESTKTEVLTETDVVQRNKPTNYEKNDIDTFYRIIISNGINWM
jgi:hypothetical protein